MAYTTHGHHIRGTVLGKKPIVVLRCGGPGLCKKCSAEVWYHLTKTPIPL